MRVQTEIKRHITHKTGVGKREGGEEWPPKTAGEENQNQYEGLQPSTAREWKRRSFSSTNSPEGRKPLD